MNPKLSISKNVFQRLKTVKSSFKGCLYGVRTEESLLVLGFIVSNTPDLDDESLSRVDEAFDMVENNLPAGVDFCGYIVVGEVLEAGKSFKGNSDVSQCALLTCSTNMEQVFAGFLDNGVFQEIAYDTLEFGEIIERLYLVRTQYKANIMVQLTEESVKAVFSELRKKFSSGKLHFSVKNSDIYVGSEVSRGEVSQGDIPSIEDIFSEINRNPEGSKSKSKKETFSDYRVINIDVLVSRTEQRDEFSNKRCVRVKFSNAQKFSIPLILEGISLVPQETDTNELYDFLVDSLSRNLSLVEETLLTNLDRDEEFHSLRSYNVKMHDFGHSFLCVWPQKIDESKPVLKDQRRLFHKTFGLPLTRPYFRRKNILPEPDGQVLMNTHLGLKSNPHQHLVQGTYGYYHYMQQNYNDSGWGCAYRSFQTIFSWFRYQGYTEKPIPTHYDIQEALVSMGDKPRAFLGSTQWIGSTEVSLCLEKFLNITSRIMFVQSGKDLGDKGAELAMHFESQGTPIMIGGGVLAHTIIGVDYNRESGETKFLILDPHYTGAEDLHTIQQKGFCNWKTVNFWDKKTFYNLCMPIRPIEF